MSPLWAVPGRRSPEQKRVSRSGRLSSGPSRSALHQTRTRRGTRSGALAPCPTRPRIRIRLDDLSRRVGRRGRVPLRLKTPSPGALRRAFKLSSMLLIVIDQAPPRSRFRRSSPALLGRVRSTSLKAACLSRSLPFRGRVRPATAEYPSCVSSGDGRYGRRQSRTDCIELASKAK